MFNYTIIDISNMLSVNSETVRRWIRSGELKAQSTSKKKGYVIIRKDFEDFLELYPKYKRIYECHLTAHDPEEKLRIKLQIAQKEKLVIRLNKEIEELRSLIN